MKIIANAKYLEEQDLNQLTFTSDNVDVTIVYKPDSLSSLLFIIESLPQAIKDIIDLKIAEDWAND